jgi:hypothetical protein
LAKVSSKYFYLLLSTPSLTSPSELSLVYGSKKLSHHGIALSSLKEPTVPHSEQKSSSSSSNLAGSHTICADYSNGPVAQKSLLAILGKDYFHPLYISKRNNAICYIAILNATTLAEVDRLPSIRYFLLLYLELIIPQINYPNSSTTQTSRISALSDLIQ